MKRAQLRRIWSATAIALLCIVAAAWWQRQTLTRLAVIAGVEAIAHVRISFDRSAFGLSGADMQGVRVTSLRGEPIAQIARLQLAYDLNDLLPGGKRRFGLQRIDANAPAITVIRHADGSYNVPLPNLSRGSPSGGPPLDVRASVRDGSIDIVDESAVALPGLRRLYVRDLDVAGTFATAARSTYVATLRYGEGVGRLYPVAGNGTIDPAHDNIEHEWTAPALPIAGAVDFVTNTPAMRLSSGMLRDVEARGFGIADSNGRMQAHLSATARLEDGRIAIAGLSKPIDDVRGRMDVYDDGILTNGLSARIASIPLQISGGLYGLQRPRLRFTARGTGELAQLRSAVAQAQRLPIRGTLGFTMLVQGPVSAPVAWIALRSPQTAYASTTLDNLHGLVALSGREADIADVGAAYGRVELAGRGRVAFDKEPNAIEMLVGARAPPDAAPYAAEMLPGMTLGANVLATADDPRAIAARGVLWGSGATRRLAALFDVNAQGIGSVGPLELSDKSGSLYARVALGGPKGGTFGVVDAHDFTIAPMHARVDAQLFGERTRNAIETAGDARLFAPAWGAGQAHGRVAFADGALRGALFGSVGNTASFAATVAGTPRTPRVSGTVVVAGRRYRNFDVNGSAGVRFDRNALDVRNAEIALGPLFVGVAGTIRGIVPGAALAPHYDLIAQVHSSDVGTLVASVRPRSASLVEGSIDANVHVGGSGAAPDVSGTIAASEGSINGLSFRDFHGAVEGGLAAVALNGGSVVVGDSAIGLSATATRTGDAAFAVRAPHLDLADLNDFFDQGDVLGGTGSLAMQAHVDGRQILATSGNAQFSGARVRRIALGNVAAHWSSSGETIATALRFGGPNGSVALNGSVAPNAKRVDLHAAVSNLDLGVWLPMLGFNAPVSVTGKLDARTDVVGTYPDVAMQLHAAVFGGTAGSLTIDRFEVDASAAHGRGTIASAELDLPYLTTRGSGTFGLRPSDRLALALHSTSPDVGEFLARAGEKRIAVHGTLDSTLRIEGTPEQHRLDDAIAMESVRYGSFALPRIAADVQADRHAVDVRNGEVDFSRGRALLSAHVPIGMTRSKATLVDAPISASLIADDVELSNFVDLLPKGTQLSGRVDGRVNANGTIAAPQLAGSLGLRNATINGPIEKSPITGISADLAFGGNRAQMQSHAFVGGGTITAQATAALTDLRRPGAATFIAQAQASNARLDLPAYFQGTLNGNVALVRSGTAVPQVTGDMTITNARIPLNSLLNQHGGPNKGPGLPNVAFHDVRVSAGANVRVQSANVDVGTTGSALLGGTLEAPTLAGTFRSTGGSLSFYRNFYVERAAVSFDPSSGVIPDIDAVATTFVPDPATAVRLHVTGQVTNMNLELASDPSYDREQILGLLVGAQQFGAVRGVQSTGGGTFSAGSAAQSLAFGQLNTAFTRTLLEPLSASLGGSLGFTEVQITSDIQTGVGVNAVKAFGKYVNAIYAQSFGYPRTQSVGLEARPNAGTGLRLTAYTSTGPTLFALQQQPQPIAFGVLNLNPLTAYSPITGTNGVTFNYLRKFP
ncbi:MAG TPA: translocation/assembly module TamB domain-containing protein [Candidatus Cybelea sp.]|nr:translocation/assembly module TamB domain-containing protein [Candidatus Cybelea sp.]